MHISKLTLIIPIITLVKRIGSVLIITILSGFET